MIPTGDLPCFTAAAVQRAPVFLNAMATAEVAAAAIREAAAGGAKLVVFPEVFIPGYPYWSWITNPVTASPWFEKLVKASILLPGPEIALVCDAAAAHGVHVVIGVNERSPVSLGTLYNTLVFIGSDGRIIGKHRRHRIADITHFIDSDDRLIFVGCAVFVIEILDVVARQCGNHARQLLRRRHRPHLPDHGPQAGLAGR